MRFLLTFIAILLPAIGTCDTGSGLLNSFFKSNDVATKIATFKHNFDGSSGLDFSPDGKYLATPGTYNYKNKVTIQIWDWKSERVMHTLELAQGANSGLTTEPIRYSPDGKLLAACHSRAYGDVVIRLWNVSTVEIKHDIIDSVPGDCNAIGFTPDAKLLVRIANRNPQFPSDNLIVYDADTGNRLWGLRTLPFQPDTLAVSPDGKFAALGGHMISSRSPQIIIVDLIERAIVRTIPNTVSFTFGRLAWSPDGTNLAAFGNRAWDGTANNGNGAYIGGTDTVMIFDAQSGKQIAGEKLEKIGHLSLRYTPDGKYLIEGDMDGLGNGLGVMIWDGQHRELLQKISGNIGGLAVSRDGHLLAARENNKITVWQLK
jgi:WD40 repeat protein